MYVLLWTLGCESIVILSLEMVDIPLKYRSNKQYIDHNHHRALKFKTVLKCFFINFNNCVLTSTTAYKYK